MSLIMGLDVSTSVTGVCVIDTESELTSQILLLDRIEFPRCRTLWDKADVVSTYMDDVIRGSFDDGRLPRGICVDRVVVEEPLMGFRSGMSSAQTITQLVRFNGIVSYLARRTFHKEPEYIGSAHARKLCGMKMQKTSVAGPQKEQVFAYMAQHDLAHVTWPTMKSGRIVDWSRDATDAYVIARAAANEGVVVHKQKVKKSKKQ